MQNISLKSRLQFNVTMNKLNCRMNEFVSKTLVNSDTNILILELERSSLLHEQLEIK